MDSLRELVESGLTANVKVVHYKKAPTRERSLEESQEMFRRALALRQPQKTYEFIVDIEEVQLVPFDPDTLTFMAATPELRARYAIKRDFTMVGIQDTTMVLPMVNGKPPIITREVLEEIKDAYQKTIFMQYRIADTKTEHLQVIAATWQKLAAMDPRFQKPYAEVSEKLVTQHVSKTAYGDLKEFNKSVLSTDIKLNTVLNSLGENLKRLNALISRLPEKLMVMDIHLIVEFELCALRLRAYNSLISEYRKFFKRNVLPGVPVLTLAHPNTQKGIMDKLTETTHWLGENQTAMAKCERSANRINRAMRASATAAAPVVEPEDATAGNSSSTSARLPFADTPQARAFQLVKLETDKVGIDFESMVPTSVVDGKIHPAINAAHIQIVFAEYSKRFKESIPELDIDMILAVRVVNKWIALQKQIHLDFTIKQYGTSGLSSVEQEAFNLQRIGPEFHTLMSKFNTSWLALMDKLERLMDIQVFIGNEFASLAAELAILTRTVDVTKACPLDVAARFGLRRMQMTLCNHAVDQYMSIMDKFVVPDVQVSDLLNSGQMARANEMLAKTDTCIANNEQKFRTCFTLMSMGSTPRDAPEIKQPSVGSSSSSAPSSDVAEETRTAKEKYLAEQLERLRQDLPDTADARAYRTAFAVLASVGLSIDTWVQLQTGAENGGYDVTFPSDVIPDICGAYATKLVAIFPPVGTDLKEATRLASSWSVAMRALATDRTATAETLEIVEFQSRISDWGRATANRLKPVVRTLETLVPRMEKIKRALNKKKTEWPVDLDTDYNLCMAWQDTICVPLSKHVLYLLTPLHDDIAFIHLMDKDAQKACMSFVQTFKAGQDKLAIISGEVRQMVERTLKNIERMKKEEQAAQINSAAAAADDRPSIQPVQYQAASSSSGSSSTAVPNSQKRKEKVKTRAGHMAAVEEEGNNDDYAPVIDNLYISNDDDDDDDRPQGAGVTPFQLRQQKIAAQNKGWDKNRIRVAARKEILAEETSRQAQREQIEALRERVKQANSQDDLPAVAAAPPGGHSRFAAAASSSTGEDTMTYLPGGHTGHLTEKQAKKLAKKKQAKATSLDEFHAQMEAEKKKEKQKKR